jgi:hypothetical protein
MRFAASSLPRICLHVWLEMASHTFVGRRLAMRCIDAKQNVLRVIGGWNICVNLHWQACAALGKLPGQGADCYVRTLGANQNLCCGVCTCATVQQSFVNITHVKHALHVCSHSDTYDPWPH